MIKPILSVLVPFSGQKSADAMVALDSILRRDLCASMSPSYRALEVGDPPPVGLETVDLNTLGDAIDRMSDKAGAIISYTVQAGKLNFDASVSVYAPNMEHGLLTLTFDKTFTSRFLDRKAVQLDVYRAVLALLDAFHVDYALVAHNVEVALLPAEDPVDRAELEAMLGPFGRLYAIAVREAAIECGRFSWAQKEAQNERTFTELSISVFEFLDFHSLALAYERTM